jgi:amino acid adenylation domain-containing protein
MMNDDHCGLPAEHRHPERMRRIHPTNAFIRFEEEETEQSIAQRFEQQVSRYPDRLAVKTKNHRLSYAALNKVANRVARALLAQRSEGAESIALLLEHDAPMIAAILGVLKAGKVYVPLDPSFPYARNAYILEDSQAGLIITNNENRSLAESLSENRHSLINIDETGATFSDENIDLPISADNLANIIYTSGSTGQPKGVVQNHRNLLHVAMRYTNGLQIMAEDRLTLLQSYSVAGSASNMFGALLNGASLFPFNVKEEGPIELADLLIEEEITVYHSVPTVFRQFANTLTGKEEFPGLRLVRLGGEPVSAGDVQLYKRYFPSDSIFVNSYGASEAASVLRYSVDKDTEISDAVVPVGYPLGDVDILLLDDEGAAVGCNHVGEIAIKSRHVSPGYWRRPDLTRAAFVTDPQDEGGWVYRTGDLGYLQPDGCLVVTGRNDFRVKIRGFRIEVAEIERALRGLAKIKEAAVVAHDDQHGEKQLVAYVVSEREQVPTIGELRGFLKDKLPDYMVPSAFVVLDALPLTPNGKLDRLALPAPSLARLELDTDFVAPRNALEEQLVEIWVEVLGVTRVGVYDDFFELGGHSLRVTQLVSRVREVFQVELPLLSLFEEPTIAGLAERIEEARRGAQGLTAPPLLPASRDAQLPLSFSQQRMWLLDQLEPGNPAYHISHALRLSGTLDAEALKRSLEEIVSRHEALRTTFATVNGEPVQVISPTMDVTLPVEDLGGMPQAEREAEAKRLALEEKRRPFDLERGPLFRAGLLRLGEEEHVLLISMHHVVSDGWSMGVFWREFGALYRAFSRGETSPLAELPIQYADYALWQRQWLTGEVLEEQLSYWKGQLADMGALELPTDHPRPAVQSHRGARQELVLPESLTRALNELSRREGTTLFMVLLGAFQALLARYSGQEDIAVGSPIAGRTRAETEELIGFFVNTLVMRTDLSGDPSFREALSRVREVALGAYDHQDLPFEKLVEELRPERDLSRTPLFQVFFALQNVPRQALKLPNLTLERQKDESSTVAFDLSLLLSEQAQGLKGYLEYSADLFDDGTIERMISHFQTLLEGIVEDPDRRLSELEVLSEAERHRLLFEWNETATEYPRDRCIHTLLEEQAERTPDAVAVTLEDQQLTYRELNRRANQLAHHLRALGVGPEVLVGICVERSLEMVVGLLGILKAGGGYVPLDPSYPATRLKFILGDARAPVLLTQERLVERLPDEHGAEVVRLDADWPAIARKAEENVASNATADNIAYVIYTSGSTGQPKGVMIEHRALSSYVAAAIAAYEITVSDRVLQFASLSFDASVEEIFPSLTCGGTLVLRSDRMIDSMQRFVRECTECAISVLDLPTAFWHELVLAFEGEGLTLPPSVRLVIIGGENALAERVAQWHSHTAQTARPARLINTYGPTEATVVATSCELRPGANDDPARDEVPIGRPLGNARIYILDGALNPSPIGVPGELHVGGSGLARGYINRSELTSERFFADPFNDAPGARLYKTGDVARWRTDGNIEFVGRVDDQVKIRGFRVEPGEVEAVLVQHPALRGTAVLARMDTSGDERLVAYVVPQRQPAPTARELGGYLKEKLPEYMVPSAFVTLDGLPLTPSGKIDRRSLPAPGQSDIQAENAYAEPRTPVEEQLVEIWEEVLGLERVGIHDDFFELGGHSLLAMRIVARVREVFQVELPLLSLFEEPTIAGLALTVTQMQAEAEIDIEQIACSSGAAAGPLDSQRVLLGTVNDRARRIANLSPEKRRLLELILRERSQAHTDEGISKLPRYSESGQPRVFPLSSAQRLMWRNVERHPRAHKVPQAIRLRGPLDVTALEASLHEICSRHETLRTTFGTCNGEPVQIVGPPQPVSLTRVDLRELPPEAREADVSRLIVRESRRPFDLSRDLMLRATLLRLDDEEHVLLLVIHHIAYDGESESVLFAELSALYNALRAGRRAKLPELPVQYVDYVVWQWQRLQDGELQRLMDYWKNQLADTPLALHMPAGQRPLWPSRKERRARQKLRMPAWLLQELHVLCRRQNVTLFMTLLATWATLLHRYSGEEDILIGTYAANRNWREVERLVGCYLNGYLILRHDLGKDPSFTELLQRVRKTTLDAFSHSELPEEILLKELYVRCDIMFTLQNNSLSSLKLDGLQAVERIEIDRGGGSSFLKLTMIQGDEDLTARLAYNTNIFDAATIQRMLGDLQSLLEGIVADPEQRISGLPLLTEAEQLAPAGARSWSIRFRKRFRWGLRHARRGAGRFVRAGKAWPLVGSLFARIQRVFGRLLPPGLAEPFRMPSAGLQSGSDQTQAASSRSK